MSNMKFLKNDEGVSPIVATLVLIVVAIVGAAAVGLIMGSFSSSVGQQANSGHTQTAASTTISVAGSTSMFPVISQLAQWYNTNNTGVQVNVVAGGSGAGYVSVGQGIADIGMISEAIVSTEAAKYPNLKAYQVGSSAVVFATASTSTITKGMVVGTPITTADLKSIFTNTMIDGVSESVGRSDVSGTQDTATSYLGLTSSTWKPTNSQSGNGGVLGEIKKTANSVGILDSDYAFGSSGTGITALFIDDGTTVYTPTAANVLTEIKTNPTPAVYPAGLVRPLNLITNGPAGSLDDGFIQYCQNPNFAGVYAAANQVAVTSVAPAFLQ